MCKVKQYKVQKGDTLCLIAKKFNVSIKQIADLNDITNVDFIKEGDLIIIWQ